MTPVKQKKGLTGQAKTGNKRKNFVLFNFRVFVVKKLRKMRSEQPISDHGYWKTYTENSS